MNKRTKLVRHAVKQAKRTSDRKIVDSKYSSNFVGHSSFLLSITSLSTFFRVKDHANHLFYAGTDVLISKGSRLVKILQFCLTFFKPMFNFSSSKLVQKI